METKAGLTSAKGITPELADKFRNRRRLMKGLAKHEERIGPPRNDLAPKYALETRALDSLKPASKRVRRSDPVQIARIVESIKMYGCLPILITADGTLIQGHLAYEAAKLVGLKSISCIVVDHLTSEDVRRLRITLNRLGETGDWDFLALKQEVRELALEFEGPFEIPGLDSEEMDLLFQDDIIDAMQMASSEAIPTVMEKSISKRGDIWCLGPHRVGCGDAKDMAFILQLVSAGEIRLCLTDVPYGVAIVGHVTSGSHRDFVEGGAGTSKAELRALFDASFKIIYELLIEGGIFMSFIDWRSVESMLAAGREGGFDLLNLVVWAKTNAGMGSLYRSHHELCPVFKKGKASHVNNISLGRKGRYRTNLWTYPGASSFGSDAREGLEVHPTVKGVAMLEDAILDVTERGDIVFDPFAGSGSTLIAAHQCGRVFRGCDLDELYVDVILRRWLARTDIMPTLLETGETFEAVVARREARP